MSGFSETRRQLVHIGSAAFALLLPVLTWWQAALLAMTAVCFNLFVLPRRGGRSLFRAADEVRGYPIGILLYPIAVLLLILIFPRRPDIVAAAWGILAFGDGCATLAGRRVGGRRLPWNGAKTWVGTATFVVAGAAGGIALAWWARNAASPPATTTFIVAATSAAAVAAALVETVPSRLDDNLSVPAVAALVLWGGSLIDGQAELVREALTGSHLLAAVAVNAVVAWAGWKAASVSTSGALTGMAIGFVIYVGAGPWGWALLLAAFAAVVIASRMGLKRKVLLGIAQEAGGRRGGGNAVANCGIAAFAALIALSSPFREAALLAVVAALTAGASDTIASEIGKAWGRHTFLSIGFRPVAPGTSGAVSLEGTAAGVVAAIGLATFGAAAGLIAPRFLWIVVAGAFAGSVVESFLGATLEESGILNNDQLNFINTAVAAGGALLLARVMA